MDPSTLDVLVQVNLNKDGNIPNHWLKCLSFAGLR